MISNSIFIWISALITGVFLGIFYFGFLWWSVNRISRTRHPIILTIGGYVIRLAIAILVFYLILRIGDWRALLICLAGFIITRIILVKRLGNQSPLEDFSKKGKAEYEYQS